MSFPFIFGLIPLFISPVFILLIFQTVFQIEKNQIALDNAAIMMGRQDRDLFRIIENTNKLLKKIEKKHHYLHACALISPDPRVRVICQTQDRAIELEMSLLIEKTRFQSQYLWFLSRSKGIAEANKLNVHIDSIKRETSAPIRFEECPFCHKKNHIFIYDIKNETVLLINSPKSLGTHLAWENLNYYFKQ